MRVDIWSDIACPFCYVGMHQLNKAVDKFAHKDKLSIVHHSYQLTPHWPKKTNKKLHELIAESMGGSVSQAKAMNSNAASAARAEGLQANMDDIVPVNTFDAHQLIHMAAEQGKEHEAIDRLFAAYFVNGESVADTDTLVAIGEEVGLDKATVRKSLQTNKYADDVREDIRQAKSLGIRGVPYFVIDDKYAMSGARGVSGFSSVLQKAWHEAHPIETIDDELGGEAGVCADGICLPSRDSYE